MARKKAVDPGKIRVRVLGTTEIMVGHRRIGMNTEVLFALALYLTTRAGERIPREELLPLFWNEGDEEDRRHALRQQMYRLRQKGLEVDDGGEQILLEPHRVESDLRNALAEDWWEHATEDDITRACEWGPVFARHKVPEFLEWIDSVRSALGQNIRRAAFRQIGIARREGRWADLDTWGRVMISTDPLNEEGTLARAESAAMGGSKTVALEIIDNYLSEMGDIDPELNKPALQLRKRIAERRPDWAMRGPKEVPLVGRMELMTKLTGLVEDVWKGEGRAVVLTGAAGIGKTRLAMEARAYAELKGMRTVMIRSEASNAVRPLSVVQRLANALLALPGARGCHPDSLRLLEQVLERSQALSRHDLASYMYSISSRVPDAITDLVEAIIHEGRLTVVIDDLHLADRQSLESLQSVIAATAGSRVGWICTTRDMHATENSDVDIARTSLSISVGPLSTAETESLATATSAQHGIALSSVAAGNVAIASGGNALFARELAVAGRSRPSANKLPETLSRVIEERLHSLGVRSRDLLRAVALLGGEATLTRIERTLPGGVGLVASDVELLERDGIISLSESRALVLHDCWRQSLLDSMAGATRASVARQCARAICADAPAVRDPHATWKAAELFAEAGDTRASVELFAQAAEALYGAGLPGESVQVLRLALKLPSSDVERFAQRAMLVSALVASGDPLGAISESADSVSDQLLHSKHAKNAAAQLLWSRCDALFKAGRPMLREVDMLLGLSKDEDVDEVHRARCALAGIAWATNAGDHARRDEFARSVDATARSVPARMVKMIFHAECGSREALAAAVDALSPEAIAEESPYLRCRALRAKCRALRVLSRQPEALEAARASLAAAESALLYYDAAIVSEQIVHIYLDRNDIDSATECLGNLKAFPDHDTHERHSAIHHAYERICIQRGQFEEVVARQTARDSAIRADWNTHRQMTELATRAFALAHCGATQEARRLVEEILQWTNPYLGGFSLDYVVELTAKTLLILGEHARAAEIAEQQVLATLRIVPREFQPFYQALSESRAMLVRT